MVIARCTFALLLGASRVLGQNALTADEKKDGWILLFDGSTLNGWEARPTSVAGTAGDWQAAGGALVCGGTVPSWIATRDSFGDFRLDPSCTR